MDLQFEISKRLTREHQDVGSLLARFQGFLQRGGATAQPDGQGTDTQRLLGDLRGALRRGIPNHFAIEEQALFPLLTKADGADLVELLLADHRVILGLATELRPLVEKALETAGALSQPEWETLRAKGQAFITELSAHAEKEDVSLVPMMDELMDPTVARGILDRYLQM